MIIRMIRVRNRFRQSILLKKIMPCTLSVMMSCCYIQSYSQFIVYLREDLVDGTKSQICESFCDDVFIFMPLHRKRKL